MKYTKPNLEKEWMEALRYREFEKMGKDGWLDVASNNYAITNYEKIKNVLTNIDLDFESLEEDKKKRFEEAFEKGEVEIPMVVKFSEDDYDLLGGNTRLAGLINKGINPKLWVVDLSKKELQNESENLEGGEGDNKTLEDIAKKHDQKGYYHIDNMVDSLKKQLEMGVEVELEHTDDPDKAKEIAMDHLWEDPSYYTKLSRIENQDNNDNMVSGVAEILKQIQDIDNRKEVFDNMIEKFHNEDVEFDEDEFSRMSGLKSEKGEKEIDEDCWDGYKAVGGKMKNGKMVPNCVPKNESEGDTNEASSPAQQAAIAINMKKKGIKPKNETKEQTDAGSSGAFVGPLSGGPIKKDINEVVDASSSGEYDVPAFGKTSRGGRKDPLKIDGPDSIGKSRAVKDKNFPKFGGPGGIFIKIKEKCKKFPYCNQGDINTIEVLRESIEEISKNSGLPYKEIENIVLNEIKQIFI